MSAMTARAARMTEYQYLVMKLLTVMMLLSEKRSSRRVSRGPSGSTWHQINKINGSQFSGIAAARTGDKIRSFHLLISKCPTNFNV